MIEKLSVRMMIKLFLLFVIVVLHSQGYSQTSDWGQNTDSLLNTWYPKSARDTLLNDLTYPAKFECISVLDCWHDSVEQLFGKGYYRDEGGHCGTTLYTDPKKKVILRIEWGVDWHVDEISFSSGTEYLPPSFKSIGQLPDSSISPRLSPRSALEGGIRLGSSVKILLHTFGTQTHDTVQNGCRVISYQADYRTTKNVLCYESWFWFKNDALIRFEIYNGE